MFSTFTSKLPWDTCDNKWNSDGEYVSLFIYKFLFSVTLWNLQIVRVLIDAELHLDTLS